MSAPKSRAKKAPLSVGIDCADVERWRGMLSDIKKGAARRLFTQSEHRRCQALPDPPAGYAACWCAKEAVFKALSPRGPVDLRRIEILFDQKGRARVALPAGSGLGDTRVEVCLSRSPLLTLAVAVARRG